MSAVVAPVNPMAAEGKETVLDVLRRDQQRFFDLVEDPKNWNVQTRCTEWEVRDLVGHLIDVTEGYLSRWEVAKKGESADAVGLSILSGAHMTLVPRVTELLKQKEAGDVVVIVGGTIPADDIPELKRLGIAEVFTPGASTQEIIEFVRGAVRPD